MLDNLKLWDQRMVIQFVNKARPLTSALYGKSFYNIPMRTKIFSFHRDAVDCFNKLKHHKAHEMGRQFQIGRIGGNFVWSIPNFSQRMHDPESLHPMVRGHLNTFQTPILSAVMDKGYYSKANEKFLLDFKIEDVALQRPIRKFTNAPPNPITPERLEALAHRRSGIEPIISHLKRLWQMGRSRMKLDRSTESSGFCAMLGFNLYK